MGCVGMMWDVEDGKIGVVLDVVSVWLDFVMLVYLVVMMMEVFVYKGLCEVLFGKELVFELVEKFLLEKWV